MTLLAGVVRVLDRLEVDIDQLLAAADALGDLAQIDQRVAALPRPSRDLWQQLRTRRAR